ncbi:MAG: HAMP domain-containing histidine kinase [Ruminococcus sp.]|nr:HAMP domain-containing histidine kinase [Ruminococcus sp.]MBR1753127.1 HAMP domain-containing histidine kinase [Ruminococcus sp.]
MKAFDRLAALCIVILAAGFVVLNVLLLNERSKEDNVYKVEINRAVQEISNGEKADVSSFEYITGIYEDDGSSDFYSTGGEYTVRRIDGKIYRIDYERPEKKDMSTVAAANVIMGLLSAAVIGVLVYLRRSIVKPFNELRDYPLELSKGNLTMPLKEKSSKHFGRFVWGLDMLRQRLEKAREDELELAKKEKTMLLSLSHDIKTPLSAIKLSSQALSRGLYSDEKKRRETAASIGKKADEIESYLGQIISRAENEFLTYEIHMTQVYLSEIIRRIQEYYSDKLSLTGTEFIVEDYSDCMLSADPERLIEAIQNIFENAIKYGDGKRISVSVREEENCRLITVENTGCTLPESEIDDIFLSFRRGPNVGNKPGSGLGLYICRRLMSDMGGDVYAETSDGLMRVTVVCKKA